MFTVVSQVKYCEWVFLCQAANQIRRRKSSVRARREAEELTNEKSLVRASA